MNFFLIVIYGYIGLAVLLIFFILRDKRVRGLFFNRHYAFAFFCIATLSLGIITGLYSTLVEPFRLTTKIVNLQSPKIKDKITIAFVSDMQVGQWKKEGWAEKITKRVEEQNPDLVILGGDQIDNEGTGIDESIYLEPLARLANKYPVYYVLGNHEYGIGGRVRFFPAKFTGNRSQFVTNRLNSYGFKLLRNSLDCPLVKNQTICLFGFDEIWHLPPNFNGLTNLSKKLPLILVSHNPDGIIYYQNSLPKPDLVLSGHTHAGQLYLPFIGPIAGAQTILDFSYYRGLNYYRGTPIYTSVGTGESGAPLRLFAVPEITIINLSL